MFGRRGKTPESLETVIPSLPDDEQEAREALAFHKGVVAFDIVFDGVGTPFVLEIQSTDAGASGLTDALVTDSRVSDAVYRFAQGYVKGKSGYSNPEWFHEVAGRKDEQLSFIPEGNRPHSVVNGDFDALFKFGKVLIKPLNESQGTGIRIFDNAHMAEAHEYAATVKKRYGGFMAQSFVESSGAELAPANMRHHAASLRLIIPFEVIDGKPVITVHGVGYQRVAPEPMPDASTSGDPSYEKAGVVNRHRGARSAPMSEAEYQRALPVVLAVLENLVAHGDTSEAYQEGLMQLLASKTSEVLQQLNSDGTWRPAITTQTRRFESLEEARAANRFIRFVERELSLLKPETRAKLSERGVSVLISHKEGISGAINIYVPKNIGTINETLDFTTRDDAGVLVRLLEVAADGRKPRKYD